MDFINNADESARDDDGILPFVPASRALIFRSRRAALQAATVTILPVDSLLDRTRDKTLRITPRPPAAVEDQPYSLFKTVSAMRSQQGYRLR